MEWLAFATGLISLIGFVLKEIFDKDAARKKADAEFQAGEKARQATQDAALQTKQDSAASASAGASAALHAFDPPAPGGGAAG